MAFIVDINGNKQSLNMRKPQTKEEEIEHFTHQNSVEHYSFPGMEDKPEWQSWLVLAIVILAVLGLLWHFKVHTKLMNLVSGKSAPSGPVTGRFSMNHAGSPAHFGFRFY
jgi:hypothetical protein